MNRKYTWKLFLIGVIINFVFHYFYLFLPGVMSRKKQIIPMLSALWG